MRNFLTVGGAVSCVLIVFACGSSGSSAPPKKTDNGTAPLIADVKASLDGRPSASTQSGTRFLIDGLDARDWGYLLSAEWPTDAEAVLADPVLQKAITVMLPHIASGGAASVTQTLHPTSLVASGQTISGAVDMATMNAFVAGVNALTPQYNGGKAKLGSAVAVTSYVNGVISVTQQSSGTPIPAAGAPADPITSACVTTFYAGGTSSTVCDTSAFCCRGTIDYTSNGKLTCFDATSCKGTGAPPPKLSAGAGAAGDGGLSGNDPCGLIGVWDYTQTPSSCGTCQYGPDRLSVSADDVQRGTQGDKLTLPNGYVVDLKTCQVDTSGPCDSYGQKHCPANVVAQACPQKVTGSFANGTGTTTVNAFCPYGSCASCSVVQQWTKRPPCIATGQACDGTKPQACCSGACAQQAGGNYLCQ